jgi:hypothetical protein
MAYIPTTINKKDALVLQTLKQNSQKNIDKALEDTQQLIQALKIYKEALADSQDIATEEADIICKYSTKPTLGSYNLPSILIGSRADYDISAVKDDNKRLEDLKSMTTRANSQADMYLKIVLQNYHDLMAEIKKMELFKSNIEQALSLLQDQGY